MAQGFGGAFSEQSGHAIYKGICQGCHMPDAKGAHGAGVYPALVQDPRLATAAYPVLIVTRGQKGMPAFDRYLSDDQIANVVNYIRGHFGNHYTDKVAPDDVKKDRPTVQASAAVPQTAPHASSASATDEEGGEDMKRTKKGGIHGILMALGLAGAATSAHAADIVRTPIPFPGISIAAAVTVPPGYTIYYISGAGPAVADPKAPAGSPERFGTTETQTESTLAKLKTSLGKLGLTFGDVVAAHVYLVGDPANGGNMDFAGMNKAWSKEFGTPAQPNKPARAAVQVAGLAMPGALVEIEFVAAKKTETDQ